MVRVDGVGDRRVDSRVRYRRPMRAKAAKVEVEAELLDISGSGAALQSNVLLDNNTFVELHIEGVGNMEGRVARSYEGGFAVKFEVSAEQRGRLKTAIADYTQAARILDDDKK
ncbi:MAG: PilZ domain-containing protein [Rhodospirillales bacterium]|nr:PilZ domain-containing protein [Rhodospirillales bacterium]MDP6773389.1 PilZ domain-containing protein [Rhodospirillales bacterium]